MQAGNRFRFGEFELDCGSRTLTRSGETLPLNAKSFDLLRELVESRGRVLTKDELLERVWPGQFVEENNLSVQISALRKALGDKNGKTRLIATVPGRGYSFVADVENPTNRNEIVIEKRTISHVVVEEVAAETSENPYTLASKRPTGRHFTSAIIGSAAAVIAVSAFAGLWFFGYLDRGKLGDKASPELAGRIFSTVGGGIPDAAAISPDGNTIAYVERRKGQYALKLGEIEAGNSVEVIPFGDRLYRFVSFSRDGKFIYFTVRDDNNFEPALMRVSILGGPAQPLATEVHSSFTFSPDGKTIAFFRENSIERRYSIVLADAATGKNEKVVLERTGPETIGNGISWSPDGKVIAFAVSNETDSRLQAVNVDTGETKAIGEPSTSRIVNLQWSNDGNGLFVNRNLEPHPNDGQIWFMAFPSGESKRVTDDALTFSSYCLSLSSNGKLVVLQTRTDPRVEVADPDSLTKTTVALSGARSRGEGMNGVTLAPDGKILFTAIAGNSRTIWEMNGDGSGQRQLTPTQNDSRDAQINVSSDNQSIFFESTRSGSLEVWRADRDGRNASPLTEGGGNSQPSLSSDGRWVVYVSLRDGKYGLRRISTTGGEPTVLTTEQSLWPSVSPDSKYIAYAHGRTSRYPNSEFRVIPIDGGQPVHSFKVNIRGVLYNRLRWSPDGESVLYKDHTEGLWRQVLTGTEPEFVAAEDGYRIYHFDPQKEGILMSGGRQMREIWVLSRPQ